MDNPLGGVMKQEYTEALDPDLREWVWIRDEDVAEFGSALPGSPIYRAERVISTYSSVVLGWSGAPGEYLVLAWGAQQQRERHAPGRPEVNDVVRFGSKRLMDDGVVLESMAGLRPWLGGDVLQRSMLDNRGPDAIIAGKKEEEGARG